VRQPKIVLCRHNGICYAEYEGGRHGGRGTGTTEGEAVLSLLEGSQSLIGIRIEREAVVFRETPGTGAESCIAEQATKHYTECPRPRVAEAVTDTPACDECEEAPSLINGRCQNCEDRVKNYPRIRDKERPYATNIMFPGPAYAPIKAATRRLHVPATLADAEREEIERGWQVP
jgi:hypothetical protein